MELEESQLQQVKLILQDWASNKGHDKCWHHPEILKKLCSVVGVPTEADPCLPPREEFRQGCRNYEQSLYGGKNA